MLLYFFFACKKSFSQKKKHIHLLIIAALYIDLVGKRFKFQELLIAES